jgi:hypothetical protein
LDHRKLQSEDNMRNIHLQEQRLKQQQASAKHISSKSNRMIMAARQKSLEEIFSVLLLSAEMTRELEKNKKKKATQEGKLTFFMIITFFFGVFLLPTQTTLFFWCVCILLVICVCVASS